METDPKPQKPEPEQERGEHNQLGFRNVDEQGEYDEEPGTQGEGSEPPPDE